jgi:AcrR family transcriptional regulator
MPRPRFQRVPLDKRDAILDAAAKEFATHGYDDASVNRMIVAAGMSKGSFYYYFDDKGDLAAAVIERQAEEYLDIYSQLDTPTTVSGFWSSLTRFMELGAERLRQSPHTTLDAMMRLASALSQHPELLDRLSKSVIADITRKSITFWTRGQELGAVRTDLSVAQLMRLMQDIKLTLIRLLVPSDRAPSLEEIETFGRVHLDMIRRICEPKDG